MTTLADWAKNKTDGEKEMDKSIITYLVEASKVDIDSLRRICDEYWEEHSNDKTTKYKVL